MLLSLQQAADRLGKSVRQVRYMIQTGALPARKDGGRWRVAADDLPLSSGQRAAVERRERALQSAVEDGLGIEQPSRKRWSVRDLKAFQIGLPLYHQASAERPADDPAVLALRRMLLLLGRGCHRFDRDEKAAAYREARDAASQAACELLMSGADSAQPLVDSIEQELMAALAGLLRRTDRRRGR